MERFNRNEDWARNIRNQNEITHVESENRRERQLVEKLSSFSTSLAEEITLGAKDRIKKEMEEATVLAIEEDLGKIENEGEDPIPPEEREEHEKDKITLKEHDNVVKGVAQFASENGATYNDTQKIAGLSGWALYAYTAQKASIAGQNLEPWLAGQMQNNNELKIQIDGGEVFTPQEAKTLEQKQAALKALRRKFLVDNQLGGVKRTLLGEKGGFYAQAVKANNNLMKKYRLEDTINRSFEAEEAAIETFKGTKNYKDLFDTILLKTVDPNTGARLSRAEAWKKVDTIIGSLMDTGEFTQDDLNAVGNQDSGFKDKYGKPILNKDKWKSRFIKLQEQLNQAESDNYITAEQRRSNDFKDAVEELKERASKMPDHKLNSQFWRKEHGILKRAYPGLSSDWLTAVIKNAADGEDYDEQLGQAEDLRRKGLLTTETLATFDWRIQKKFAEDAKFLDKALSKENAVHVKELEEIVSYAFTSSGLEKNHPSVGPMTEFVLAHYRRTLAAAIKADEPNPSVVASENTKMWFKDFADNPKNFDEINGYKVPGIPTNKEIRKTVRGIAKELRRQKSVISTHKDKILLPENVNKLISKEKLERSLETFYKQQPDKATFDYPGEIDTLYEMIGTKGKSKFDLMNQVLESSGLPGLGEKPPSIEKLDENTDKKDNVILSNKTFDSGARVWADIARKTDSLNIEIVPNGPEILEWSEGNDMPFEDAAAAMEVLQNNPSLAAIFGVETEETGEGINWDKFGLAVSLLGNHIKTKVGEFGEYLAPSPENSANPNVRSGKLKPQMPSNNPNVRSGKLKPQMPSNNPNLKAKTTEDGVLVLDTETDPEADLGYQIGQSISQGMSTIGDWTVDQINAWIDSLLTDDQKREIAVSKYKTTGNTSFLPIRQ